MPAVADHHSEPLRLAVEVFLRHGQDGRVDFHDVHLNSFAGQLRRRNPHAQADAQRAVNLPRVRAGQVVQHVGEECDALFCPGIVDVLGQKIVQIKPARAAFVIDDLQQAEI